MKKFKTRDRDRFAAGEVRPNWSRHTIEKWKTVGRKPVIEVKGVKDEI